MDKETETQRSNDFGRAIILGRAKLGTQTQTQASNFQDTAVFPLRHYWSELNYVQ